MRDVAGLSLRWRPAASVVTCISRVVELAGTWSLSCTCHVKARRGSKGAEGGVTVLYDMFGEIDVPSSLNDFDIGFALAVRRDHSQMRLVELMCRCPSASVMFLRLR